MHARFLRGTVIAVVLAVAAAAIAVQLRPGGDGEPAVTMPPAPQLVRLADCDEFAGVTATMDRLVADHGLYGPQPEPRLEVDPDPVGDVDGDEAGFTVREGDGGSPGASARVGPDLLAEASTRWELAADGTYTATGVLNLLDVTGPRPVLRSQLETGLRRGGRLLPVGAGRVVVLTEDREPVREGLGASMIRPAGEDRTAVALVDVRDPASPRVLSHMEVEGRLLHARVGDGVLRLALAGGRPEIDPWHPANYGNRLYAIEEEFRDLRSPTKTDVDRLNHEYRSEWERLIDEARGRLEPAHWRPHVSIDGLLAPLVSCDRISIPTSLGGFGMVTLATVETTGDHLRIRDSEAVVSDLSDLAADDGRMVIATAPWTQSSDDDDGAVVSPSPEGTELSDDRGSTRDPSVEESPDSVVTDVGSIMSSWLGAGGITALHVFDMDEPAIRHVTSGALEGSLLAGGSLAFDDGVVRAITSVGADALVTMLRIDGSEVGVLGQFDDLGATEDIKMASFMDGLLFVGSFGAADPIRVVDVTDPAHPRGTGELDVEGLDLLLHPLGEGHVLAIGQKVDPESGRSQNGQVAVFDVSVPARPTRIDVDVIGYRASHVGRHPESVTVTKDRLVIVTVWSKETAPLRSGALLYRVDDDGELDRLGLLNTGVERQLEPSRSVALDDVLLTVSRGGAVVWDRETFRALETIRFEARERISQHRTESAVRTTPGFDRVETG